PRRGRGDGDWSGLDAPLVFERLDELRKVDDRQVRKEVDDLLTRDVCHWKFSVSQIKNLRSLLFGAFARLRRQEIDEVLRRRGEERDEALERRLERREQRGAEFVLARHRRELVLDGLGVQDRALDESGLDLQLLARTLLAVRLDHLGRGAGILERPGYARHPHEHVVQRLLERLVLQGMANE